MPGRVAAILQLQMPTCRKHATTIEKQKEFEAFNTLLMVEPINRETVLALDIEIKDL